MRIFTIDGDNNIAVYAAPEEIPAGENIHAFASEKELEKLVQCMSGDELAQIWNSFAGAPPFGELKPVKKFTDRKTAVTRIWKAIQRLETPAAPQGAEGVPKGRRARKKATAEPKAAAAREGSKKAQIIELLRRPEGATLADIQSVTGWQPHSVRGFLSGTLAKKMGHKITRLKRDDGAGVYFLTE